MLKVKVTVNETWSNVLSYKTVYLLPSEMSSAVYLYKIKAYLT